MAHDDSVDDDALDSELDEVEWYRLVCFTLKDRAGDFDGPPFNSSERKDAMDMTQHYDKAIDALKSQFAKEDILIDYYVRQ